MPRNLNKIVHLWIGLLDPSIVRVKVNNNFFISQFQGIRRINAYNFEDQGSFFAMQTKKKLHKHRKVFLFQKTLRTVCTVYLLCPVRFFYNSDASKAFVIHTCPYLYIMNVCIAQSLLIIVMIFCIFALRWPQHSIIIMSDRHVFLIRGIFLSQTVQYYACQAKY
jgi:hypothetical protein